MLVPAQQMGEPRTVCKIAKIGRPCKTGLRSGMFDRAEALA
jgi:hypothetical protein